MKRVTPASVRERKRMASDALGLLADQSELGAQPGYASAERRLV